MAATERFTPYSDLNGETVLVLQALLPRVPAVLSIVGSYVILREVWAARSERKLGGAISGMLCSLSVADILFSAAFALSTWPSPSNLDYVWGNQGTTLTCTLQGFSIEVGGKASLLSNASLAILYLLRIRYHWDDKKLSSLSSLMQVLCWTLSIVLASSLLPFRLYNNGYQICTVAPSPINCKDSYHYGDDANCERGDSAWIAGPIVILVPTWICIAVSSLCMAWIYRTVRQSENRDYMRLSSSLRSLPRQCNDDPELDQANSLSDLAFVQEHDNPRSRRLFDLTVSRQKSSCVARQATWYIAAFLCSHLLLTVDCTIFFTLGPNYLSSVLDLVAFFLFPMQGLLNCTVYLRNQRPLTTEGAVFRRIFMLCPCCSEDPMYQPLFKIRGISSFYLKQSIRSPISPTTGNCCSIIADGEETREMAEIPAL